MRWKVIKARYPADPNRPWHTYPKGSPVHRHTFPTWREAFDHAYRKAR